MAKDLMKMPSGVYGLEEVMMDDETARANCGGTIPTEEYSENGNDETMEGFDMSKVK